MGTIIEATATAVAQERSMAPGALEAVDAAARSCLDRAGRTAGELDLLINVGVYHDKILSEPAFASLIQEDIGANLSQPPGAGHGTFSFDVSNGACGLLTGIQLVDGMLASGTAELGMVVASDMDPEPGVSRGFDFPAVGGAVLLSAVASRAGFTAFQFATFPEFAELFQGYVDWQEDAGRGLAHPGRNILTVEIAESYSARALECAESTARELAAAQALDLADGRPPRRHSVGPGLRRRVGEDARRARRAGRVAFGWPRPGAHGRPGGGAGVRGTPGGEHDIVRLGGRGDHRRSRALPGMI